MALPPEAADPVFFIPDRPAPVEGCDWPARPSVAAPLPRPDVLVPAFWPDVADPRTVVLTDVRLCTVLRVDAPSRTATPARRFLMIVALDGSSYRT